MPPMKVPARGGGALPVTSGAEPKVSQTAVPPRAPAPLAEPTSTPEAVKLIDAGRARSPAFGAHKPSAMVALRMVGGAAKPADPGAGTAVLSATLRDPVTGRPPTRDQVADELLALLKSGLPTEARGQLTAIAQQPAEGYYVVTYHEGTGDLALRRVAGGDESTVTVSADDVRRAVRPGEQLLGGLHNHPNKQRARASKQDGVATALLGQRFRGYVDLIVAGGSGKVSIAQVKPTAAVDHGGDVTFHAWNRNQMNRDPDKPSTVDRVDPPHTDVPNAQNHIHFERMRETRNEDGTWGHGSGDDSLLTNKEKKWIDKWDDR